MQPTAYHARYYAALLTHRPSSTRLERYLPALMSANIDLHPHQIDAALFASRTAYHDSVILADEEGLGKTIEAGIVLLQAAIEGKKRLLVLCPPALRAHWQAELEDKFNLPCHGAADMRGAGGVTLLTYPEALKHADALSAIPWDLCVLDEAHRLANASFRESTYAATLRTALQGRAKLLLTAAPMQNSLLDLYYLIRLTNETIFESNPEAFRARYMGNKPLKQELAARAQIICQRTLKRQALTMRMTERQVRTFLIAPSDAEVELSRAMSQYFHREQLAAFPKIQEHYIRLTYWKMLASSTATLASSLHKVADRLADMPQAQAEHDELLTLCDMAKAVGVTARQKAFLDALDGAMQKLGKHGAPQKAVVYSEYRATLDHLQALLEANGYQKKDIVHYKGEPSLAAFKGTAKILLATDSAGLGLNLTHCALVINYDMPYNVQRLEQRISRCHRYGQEHDVLVLNFLDPTNRADKRIYTLLNRKLAAFDDVFGASQTVLGHVRDVRVDIPMQPRTQAQMEADADAFEEENQAEINRRVQRAQADLLAYFDDAVQARFKRYGEITSRQLPRMAQQLWDITRYKLRHEAAFMEDEKRFALGKSPYKGLRLTRLSFGMDPSLPKGERYRLDHPLARRVLEACLTDTLSVGRLILSPGEGFTPGQTGEVALWQYHMLSSVDYQVHPVLCGHVTGGLPLSPEACERLLRLPVRSSQGGAISPDLEEPKEASAETVSSRMEMLKNQAFDTLRDEILLEQNHRLREELESLRIWAEDELSALSFEQQETQAQLESLKSKAKATTVFAERFRLNKDIAVLEKQRNEAEERRFYRKAEIQKKRDDLMAAARAKSTGRFWDTLLFQLEWRIGE